MHILFILLGFALVVSSTRLHGRNSRSLSSRSSEDNGKTLNRNNFNVNIQSSKPNNITLETLEQAQVYGISEAVMTHDLAPKERINQPGLSSLHQQSSINGDVVKRAVQLWLEEEFLKVNEHFGQVQTSDKIQAAIATAHKLKYDPVESKSKGGVIFNMETEKLKIIVDLWSQLDIITNSEVQEIKSNLDSPACIKSTFIERSRSNKDIIVGLVSYISLKVKETDTPTGTMIYLFRKFRFDKVETSKQESSNRKDFMNYQLAKDYARKCTPFVQYLIKEADVYSQYLPTEFKTNWKAINRNTNLSALKCRV